MGRSGAEQEEEEERDAVYLPFPAESPQADDPTPLSSPTLPPTSAQIWSGWQRDPDAVCSLSGQRSASTDEMRLRLSVKCLLSLCGSGFKHHSVVL